MEMLISEHWHHLEEGEVLHLLKSDKNKGLDLFEIKHRQEHFGPNALTAKKRTSPVSQFLLQFHQPLVYILIVAGVITGFLGEWVDAGVILGVVLVNAVIGFIQESKAIEAIEALAKTIKTETTVIREGMRQVVNAGEIVPGDMVLLQSGDKVPADMRLLHVKNLQVDESALTGESLPVQKSIDILPNDTMLAERKNMVYTSSLVTYGQGTGVVVSTGDKTEIGKISQLISEAGEIETPLTKKIARFSLILLFVIIGLAAITFAVGVFRGQSAFEMFMAAVALAVGAIPEGLPAALTITLAIGVSRMARRNAIIRKLPAVETLGSTTVICSDKTGTLTENKMAVVEILAADKSFSVTGIGYDSAGNFIFDEREVIAEEFPVLKECLVAGLLCNDSALTEKNGVRTVEGDPTEAAIIVAAEKAGFAADSVKDLYPRIDSIPFESQYQYMATLHRVEEGDYTLMYIKGAVETVLGRCDTMLDRSGNAVEINTAALKEKAEGMASRGLRVLAFAHVRLPGNRNSIDHDDLKSGLTFIGLQAMIDPPRQEAIKAIKTCHNAGINVKMITGDHVLTARAIAKQMGLFKYGSDDERAMTGEELEALCDADLVEMDGEKVTAKPGIVPLEALCDAELVEMAESVNVFARVTPDQKLRLVESLQTKNNIVAMTGDGVNDAPALKRANIGIAMGVGGTEVAKEASDMVLTDDNFASIEGGAGCLR
jgi:cation-transporting ATPase F